MTDRQQFAAVRLGRRPRLRIVSVSAACALAFALAGCRTTSIGEPVSIPIPQTLTEPEAQRLVAEWIEGDRLRTPRSGPRTRRRPVRWQIEEWQPGSIVAVQSWQSHVLRVRLEFADHTTRLEIGDSENLKQSSTRIHKRAKVLATELAQNLRLAYAKVAMHPAESPRAASASSGAATRSLCRSLWPGDARERARCERAQRRSQGRLQPMIAQVEAAPSTFQSKRLRACYARTKTADGADWEALERCFYSTPASVR